MLGNLGQKQTRKVPFLVSIRGKLILLFLSLSLIPMILLSGLAYLQSEAALRQKSTDELARLMLIEKGIMGSVA